MDAVMSGNVHAEVLWACGYALFLLAVAWGLVATRRKSRAAPFHLGLATFLVLLAGLLVGACAVRHPEGLELGLLGAVSLAVAWRARRTWVERWADASSRGEG
ncbi:hypothetical protein BO221_41260 [Archangium sp. Cb G35]|uniref:hypothetical protein n=1 Tax=Archangium sp. Cb G35 TaxID=1920190 RepID=UPI00093719EA|nr:hypothetical protein [Archangium sp. Cb G35]OJT18490.1 hypothetical protein BO221_41260 [Archangium sp. Cb G35]